MGNYQRRLLLFGWIPKSSVTNYVENQCTFEETIRQTEILEKWSKACEAFSAKPHLEFEKLSSQPIDSKYDDRLNRISTDQRFLHTFTDHPVEFRIVEVDKLIACQLTVVLDYVDKLIEKFPKRPGLDDLIDICLSLDKANPEVAELKIAGNSIIYSSENTDFRFLGAIPKPLEHIDLKTSSSGGIPVKGLLLL